MVPYVTAGIDMFPYVTAALTCAEPPPQELFSSAGDRPSGNGTSSANNDEERSSTMGRKVREHSSVELCGPHVATPCHVTVL